MRSQVAVGVFEMLTVTAIWGSVPVIFKLSGLPSPVFVFFRVAITAVLLAVALRRFTCSGLTAVLSGVFLALNWIFLFYATALMPVSTAVMIYCACPIMASIYMHFLGEKMQKPKFLALLISFTGVACFCRYDALRRITVQLASALSYLDPVYASVFAFLFLGQTPSQWTAVGGALVILGA